MTDQPPRDPRASDEHGPVVTPKRARQGGPGARILLILLASLVLIIVLYMLLWGGTQEEMGELETPADESAASQTFEGDASSPPLPADGVQPSTPE